MSAAIYCPTCGYPNDSARGACLMCYTNVRMPRGGAACPSCGSESPKSASFCMGCQAALVEGAIPHMLPDISGLVGAAVGGGPAVVSDEYVGEPAGAMDFGMPEPAHGDFDTADEFADFAASPPPPPAAVDTGAETFTPPPAPPSGGLDEEDFGAPPPPPDTVDLDLDLGEAAPPPPPAATPAAADAGGSADDLGDWSLDYDE